jgi:hypothetical protein
VPLAGCRVTLALLGCRSKGSWWKKSPLQLTSTNPAGPLWAGQQQVLLFAETGAFVLICCRCCCSSSTCLAGQNDIRNACFVCTAVCISNSKCNEHDDMARHYQTLERDGTLCCAPDSPAHHIFLYQYKHNHHLMFSELNRFQTSMQGWPRSSGTPHYHLGVKPAPPSAAHAPCARPTWGCAAA